MNDDIKEFLKTLFMFLIGMIIFWGLMHTFMKPLVFMFVGIN